MTSRTRGLLQLLWTLQLASWLLTQFFPGSALSIWGLSSLGLWVGVNTLRVGWVTPSLGSSIALDANAIALWLTQINIIGSDDMANWISHGKPEWEAFQHLFCSSSIPTRFTLLDFFVFKCDCVSVISAQCSRHKQLPAPLLFLSTSWLTHLLNAIDSLCRNSSGFPLKPCVLA
jgi:hypothetical protein